MEGLIEVVDSFYFYFRFFALVISSKSSNVLDLLLYDDPLPITTIEITCPLVLSDHNIITFHLNGTTPDTSVSSHGYYDFNRADYISLNNFLSGINWNQAFQSCFSVESNFILCLKEGIKLYVPLSSRVPQVSEDSQMIQYYRKNITKSNSNNEWKSYHDLQRKTKYTKFSKKCSNQLAAYRAKMEKKILLARIT